MAAPGASPHGGPPPGHFPPPDGSGSIPPSPSMPSKAGMAAPKGMAGAVCSPAARATGYGGPPVGMPQTGGYAPMGGPAGASPMGAPGRPSAMAAGGPPMGGPPMGGPSGPSAVQCGGMAGTAPQAHPVYEVDEALINELLSKLHAHHLVTDASQKDAQVHAAQTLVALLDEAQQVCGKVEVVVKAETAEQGEIMGKMQSLVTRDNAIKQEISAKRAQLEQIEREKMAKETQYMKMLEAAPTLAHVLKKRT
eukprot:gnl/MRDRNA2_/MRDRNA2_60983_c0_seq2.p1 gnl/MRDRNA2_/MRDRNA2_60983_c0~~gnl/MRDRNA2_/MRDRNA2_60983_c0_seq2.p1  ORF type:complete len:263 (-),score=71.13 gnl/MRDRNA2_/MRDRNA2_60983_c0_seq2:5-757(-)